MARERLRNDLPYLGAYLEEALARPPLRQGLPALVGCFVPLGIGVLAASALHINAFASVFAFFGGTVLAFIAGQFLDRHLSQPRNEQEVKRARTTEIVHRLASDGANKTAKNVVPLAGQLLESCALQRARIYSALRTQAWDSRAEETHWRSVRDQSLKAADEAMDEAILLCDPFVGKAFGKGKGDWREMVAEVLVAPSLGDALGRVDQMLRGTPDIEGYDAANLPAPLRPVHGVASKLKALAKEVEAAAEQRARSVTIESGNSIDSALEQLQAIRLAETELDDSAHLRQGL